MTILNELLNQIRTMKIYKGKSSMTSGDKWLVTLTYKGKWCKFIFNDNFENKSGKEMFLYCLVHDALAYDNARDWYDFMHEFGYADEKEAKHAYYGCEMQSHRLHRLFSTDEITILLLIE